MSQECWYEEVVSDNGIVKVVLEWIGEGACGDYDANDPGDEPLLRFSVYRKYEPGERMEVFYLDDTTPVLHCNADDLGWRPVTDGSYCTQLNANLPQEKLQQAAKHILSQVESDVTEQHRCKRLMEELSWLDETDLS